MKDQPDNSNNFITSDFYTACLLLASDYHLVGINKADSRRFRFIFTDEPDRVQVVAGYFDGLTNINARRFVNAIKELKSLMYNDAVN